MERTLVMCFRHALVALTLAVGCGMPVDSDSMELGLEDDEVAAELVPDAGGATAVATFHSIGLYWAPTDRSSSRACKVQYRPAGATQWKQGFDLWYDARNGGQYRGSLVQLQPGTLYEVSLSLDGTSTTSTLSKSTWSESFPVAQTITLPQSSSQTLTITQSGSPSGYVLYTAAPGSTATIDADSAYDNNIVINNASYVIIRGLTLKRARIHAISLLGTVHDVIIEDNDISGFGRIEADGWGANTDAAVHSRSATLERIVVQRNKMHHPRGDSNNWSEYNSTSCSGCDPYHPQGPQGIVFFDSKGNHVFRYNSMYSDESHYFNDCFGAGSNFSTTAGFPNRDSDIYGNRLSNCWDDAIESEGTNTNVRIWGNYIEDTFVGIAVASTTIGPVYVFRNVTGRSRGNDRQSWDDVPRGGVLKTKDVNGGGLVYFLHNTILQPPPPAGVTYTLGQMGTGSGGPSMNLTTRNNILHIHKNWWSSIRSDCTGGQCSHDYDLYNGTIPSGSETHGKKGVPVYASANGPGEYALASSSLGYDQALFIPNFSDGFTGAAPDIGAFEAGSPAMQFGVDAYRGSVAPPPPPPPPEPTVLPLRLDAGGAGASTFSADANVSGGGTVTHWTGAIDTAGVISPAPAAVYQSERYGTFTYTVPGLTAGTHYFVRLHFAENYRSAAGQRRFNVSLNGATVLGDFDVFAVAGAQHRAVVREFDVAADSAGRIVMAFSTIIDAALINGIEVLAEPASYCGDGMVNGGESCDDGLNNGAYGGCTSSCTRAAYCGDGVVNGPETCDDRNAISGDGCSPACQAEVIAGVSGPVSINCGGSASPPYTADAGFVGGGAVTNWTGAIDVSRVYRPAPAAVYRAERYGPMTYTFPGLSAGKRYHVRLHFAENHHTAAGQRRFDVALNGAAVLSSFDVFATAGAAHRAVVRELVASADGSGRIVLAFTNVTGSALINGIDILPAELVQNSAGLVSLEAENRVAQTMASAKSWVFATPTGYSGSGAFRASPDTGILLAPGSTSPRLDYVVRFNRTGVHYVWVRGQGPSGTSDSVHVGLDGMAPASSDKIGGGWGAGFAWTRSTADGVIATINVPSIGIHTINVWMREDGTVFDKLVLTPSSTYVPSGVGPAETR
jgi:cysteine-rich repeat protein